MPDLTGRFAHKAISGVPGSGGKVRLIRKAFPQGGSGLRTREAGGDLRQNRCHIDAGDNCRAL